MAKWRRMICGKAEDKVDYNHMCELFSSLSGAGIKYEKHGNTITLFTDGDPQEVLASIIVGGMLTLAVMGDLEEEMKFERNARMN